MKIPLFDLRSQHGHLVDEIMERWRQAFDESDFILGQAMQDFEKALAQYVGARHAIGVNSGTDALLLSLRCLDIMPGDDVLVPAFGNVSPPNVVARLFANPIFVDIDPNSYGIDPIKLQETLTDKTRVIIASHLYGHPCTIDQICQFAQANGLFVVEDATQALGSTYMNKKLGTFGITGAYSFYPNRNLGGAGDGGMIVTDDDAVAERLRRLRDNGGSEDGMVYDELGVSSRLDSIQAVFLKIKLEELDESNQDRIENARLYERLLANTPLKRPRFVDNGSHVYCHYTIEHDERDHLKGFLEEKEIEAEIYYPLPLHLQPCLQYLEYGPGDFPVAEGACKRVLSLPIYPGLKKRQIEEVGAAIQEFFQADEANEADEAQ
jgi:UDP-2-acetamido-2-deoxy-ribo-hexuluronate aminotransferase